MKIQLSLRGSLADTVQQLVRQGQHIKANAFVRALAEGDHDFLIKRMEGSKLIVGKADEVGKYPPHW